MVDDLILACDLRENGVNQTNRFVNTALDRFAEPDPFVATGV